MIKVVFGEIMVEGIKNTKALLLDLDGTVYVDGELIGDVKNTLSGFRKKGIKIVYLTNNSSRTPNDYVERLSSLGIFERNDIVYSSLDSAVNYLNKFHKGEPIYVMATDKVDAYLKEQGIIYSENAKIVLLSFDRELTYDKIVKMNELLVGGAKFIITHPDKTCPAKPVFVPDVGSIIKLFECSSGRVPDVVVGKPSPFMAEGIMHRLNLKKEEITMVGDRLSTDIQFGINCGFNTVLVLSGETTKKAYQESGLTVDLVLDDINDLKKYL